MRFRGFRFLESEPLTTYHLPLTTYHSLSVIIFPSMQNSLLQSLFDEEEQKPLSVSDLNAQVKSEVERRFTNVWVEGEIINFSAARSGHWYFSLHDATSMIRAACY